MSKDILGIHKVRSTNHIKEGGLSFAFDFDDNGAPLLHVSATTKQNTTKYGRHRSFDHTFEAEETAKIIAALQQSPERPIHNVIKYMERNEDGSGISRDLNISATHYIGGKPDTVTADILMADFAPDATVGARRSPAVLGANDMRITVPRDEYDTAIDGVIAAYDHHVSPNSITIDD
jgi:hypothetical protein